MGVFESGLVVHHGDRRGADGLNPAHDGAVLWHGGGLRRAGNTTPVLLHALASPRWRLRHELDNRDRFAESLSGSRPPGLLGYVDRKPVGWVQLGPRSEFPTLRRSRLLAPVDDVDAWSINCFVVRVGHRRSRIGKGLLAAAIQYAIQQGASVIEAYPVDGKRSGAGDYFTGIMSMFDEHGFVEVTRRNESRPIVRLQV